MTKHNRLAMVLIDTHTHIYLPELRHDINGIVQRAIDMGVSRFYLPNIDLNSWTDVLGLCDLFPTKCFPMLGLHPCSVDENYQEVLDQLLGGLQDSRVIAIGEIGIDLYWEKKFLAQQEAAFRQQIQWAIRMDLPIVIHCRNAYHEVYKILKEFQGRGLRGIFHCFTGSKQEAEKIIALGMMLGIGGVLTYKNAGLAESIKEISMNHIVLETDSPYLSPVPHRGKSNESSYLHFVAEKLAEIKQISLQEVAEITTANAMKLFHPTSKI